MRSQRFVPRAASIAIAIALPLAACQMFEPTIKSAQDLSFEERDPTHSLVLPLPSTRVEPAIEQAPLPKPTPKIGGAEKVFLDFRGKPLAMAVYAIAEHAGVNIYLDATLDRPIDANFPSITLDDALTTILARNGLKLVEELPGIYSIEQSDGNEFVERRFQLRSARVDDLDAKLKQLVAGAAGASAAIIVGDVDQNFFVVRGRRKDVEAVGEFLDAADRLKEQVLIEMRIVEVRLGERFQTGIAHALSNIDLGDGTVAILQQFTQPNAPFEVQFNSSDGDLDSTLQALGRYAGVELLSSPHVVAVNNSEATIEIIREVPYIQTTTDVSVGSTAGSTSSSSEVAFKEVGIKLKVKPAIRAGGVIEFEVDQELSEVADFLNGIPAVDRRTLKSRFEVRDGTTLVIGGLMQNRKGRTDNGIPGLMDLPLIGALFKSDDDTADKRELLVFFSPRIVSLDENDGISNRYREVYGDRRRELGLDPSAAKERVEAATNPPNGSDE